MCIWVSQLRGGACRRGSFVFSAIVLSPFWVSCATLRGVWCVRHWRCLAPEDLCNLRDGLERLMLDRRRRQPADMGGRDDVAAPRQGKGWHLVRRAPDIERRAGDALGVEGSGQRR